MTASRTVANTGLLTGSAFAGDVKEEIEALWAWGISPLTLGGGSTANAIVATCSIPILTYSVGLKIAFTVGATNTGAVTINSGTPGAVSLLSPAGAALVAGNLVAGTRILAEFTGSAFLIVAGMSVPASTLLRFAKFAYRLNAGSASPTSSVRTTYPLNVQISNDIPSCALNTSTSVIALPAGRYECEAHAQRWASSDGMNLHLRNTTNGIDEPGARMQTGYVATATWDFTITATKNFVMQYYTVGGYMANPHINEPGIDDHFGWLSIMKIG